MGYTALTGPSQSEPTPFFSLSWSFVISYSRKIELLLKALNMSSWLEIPDGSDFSLANIPYGVATFKDDTKRTTPFCVTAVGNSVIDLGSLQDAGAFDSIPELLPDTFMKPTLNQFLAHSPKVWPLVRKRLVDILGTDEGWLRDNKALKNACVFERSHVLMHLPVKIGEYTDFYSSREHATNVGVSTSLFFCHLAHNIDSLTCLYLLL